MKRIGAGVLSVMLVAGVACRSDEDRQSISNAGSAASRSAGGGEAAGVEAPAPAASAPPAPAKTGATGPLVFAAAGGDGDSWRVRSGGELRLGLVNAPEPSECYGSRAASRRKTLVAQGFRVRTYATDEHGRGVSVVTLRDGRNLNVLLAREGYVDDRFLAEFRHENESLARQLDAAFADAKAARRGLWSACVTRPAPPPAPVAPLVSGCHPDYATCIPVKGNGSGSGAANDLDCPDIRRLVHLRRVGVDPYRLDADGDGKGCDSYA